MGEKVTLPALQGMKRGSRKIVGVVAWDFQIARIADRAGVDIVSVGDSVGMNLWGRKDPEDMTLDEMILVGRAVRAGVERALVSVDFPYGVLQQGTDAALAAARRVMKETGADLVKLDEAAAFPQAVRDPRLPDSLGQDVAWTIIDRLFDGSVYEIDSRSLDLVSQPAEAAGHLSNSAGRPTLLWPMAA